MANISYQLPGRPDLPYCRLDVPLLHPGLTCLLVHFPEHLLEILRRRRNDHLEDNGVARSHDDELRPRLQAQTFPDLLRDDHLTFGRQFVVDNASITAPPGLSYWKDYNTSIRSVSPEEDGAWFARSTPEYRDDSEDVWRQRGPWRGQLQDAGG